MNRWDNTLVQVNTGTKINGWNHEDNEPIDGWVVEDQGFGLPTFRVVNAIACPTIHGGGSELTIAEVYTNGAGRITGDWRGEYTFRCHSSQVTQVTGS